MASEDTAIISEWAVDEQANGPASQIYCKANGNYYASVNGIHRPDVAAAYQNENYKHSGFLLTVPVADILEAGCLEIDVISNDGESKFEPIVINIVQ